MTRPTQAQLELINKFTTEDLKPEQVFVFTSLSADTLPVSRQGWMGEYFIHMNKNMLLDLKRDYQKGAGLLASHNSRRLPFGKTFDATIKTDRVGNDDVETLYIDHYIVQYLEGEDGEKIKLGTEINGMTTEDIINHIRVGHTFDTSIGFAITDCQCSICGNDIRDYSKCSHYPGEMYDVQNGDKAEKQRCDLIANGGEGLENSIVYAGAVNRAIIQNGKESFSHDPAVQPDVKEHDVQMYNVDDVKKIPLNAEIFCRFSKDSGMQMFTNTPNRQENMEDANMTNQTQETQLGTGVELTAAPLRTMYSEEQYKQVLEEKVGLGKDLEQAQKDLGKAQEELAVATALNVELQAKAILADQYKADLITETLAAGVKAHGNSFKEERYSKYLATLSVDEIKEERDTFREAFSAGIDEARATRQELDDKGDTTAQMSADEKRAIAAKNAMQRWNASGGTGDLMQMTNEELAKLG